MKHQAQFRGVKMGDIRKIVNQLVLQQDTTAMNLTNVDDLRVETALHCFEQVYTEDKLAGILLLGEHTELQTHHLDQLERAFLHIHDWNVCDWYCVKVLGPFMEHGEEENQVMERAQRIAAWKNEKLMWQRRASAVSFVYLINKPEYEGLIPLVLDVCKQNAQERSTRFLQTSVGWVLRELSKTQPQVVRDFLNEHELSKEAYSNATKYMKIKK